MLLIKAGTPSIDGVPLFIFKRKEKENEQNGLQRGNRK